MQLFENKEDMRLLLELKLSELKALNNLLPADYTGLTVGQRGLLVRLNALLSSVDPEG